MAIPESDPYYAAEVVPAPLKKFMYALASAYGASTGAVGIRGNRKTHFRGGHRSWNFIKFSVHCTNRTYTVSRTPGDRDPANKNACAAGDLSLPTAKLIKLCQRVDAAARSGLFEGLTEWYGNDDGDNRVDGYDNIANVLATSDDSHLWHIHMTFDRGIIEDEEFFERLLAFILKEDDMEISDRLIVPKPPAYALPTSSQGRPDIAATDAWTLATLNAEYAAKLAKENAAKLDALVAASSNEVQRDAEDRLRLIQLQDTVDSIQAGDPEVLAQLLGDRLTAEFVETLGNIRLRVEPTSPEE